MRAEAGRITRRKIIPATSSDLGYGVHGRRMMVHRTPARWAVYLDDECIGEYRGGRFEWSGRRGGGVHYGRTWAIVRAKIERGLAA